ncbi:hypothetical protein C8046_12455 [Serinibacter arcticus]|uniref:Phosphatidic acid phosphatase type 2/haloperoxidase domain-containing protein n=1 Tax=Serinibacter arcticus TaxID=1655435 RepID=A0A2U1ZWK0_9MICO|nr:phosphatase PAP2 family protein [Serinibacter arcticus]PWD51351.1 hypothetical protein C8046_12455 [Serinibacter arcticus]
MPDLPDAAAGADPVGAATPVDPADDRPRRREAAVAGGLAVVVSVVIGLVVMFGFRGENALDRGWADLMASMRDAAPWFMAVARGLDQFGGHLLGIVVVPLVVALVLLLAGRRWGALYFLVSTVAGAALVQLLKFLYARERPQDMLVTSDAGSFPSGHVANACVMALVLAILVGRAWFWVVAVLYALAMLVSRTYLSVHWLTDTLGGLAVAVGVVLLIGAAMWKPLSREWEGRQSRAVSAA